MTDGKPPDSKRSLYLGMRPGDLDGMWYARYWKPQMAPLPGHIKDALGLGPQASPLLPSKEGLPALAEPGYQEFENGFGIDADGAGCVACLTHMPGVSPAMWDWWFAWHGSDTRRYKLWHPRAHLCAGWEDGRTDRLGPGDRDCYVGRTSIVDEYVGSTQIGLAIRFVPPSTLGFDSQAFADPDSATAICARVGLSALPVDSGYLVHYVRRVDGGAEMRSRFMLGGRYVAARGDVKLPTETSTKESEAALTWPTYNLLSHCAQEMNHLAKFLPDIHAEFKKRGGVSQWQDQ